MHLVLKLANRVCDAEIFSAVLRSIHSKIWAKKWCGIIQLENLFGKYAEIIFRTFLEARYPCARFGVLGKLYQFSMCFTKNVFNSFRLRLNTSARIQFIRYDGISYRLPAPIQLNIFPFRISLRVFN